jgi:hydroxymethylpyrimidine/phosphomethylpyrimidine kinase
VTPNLPEAMELARMQQVETREQMLEAAQRIGDCGCEWVVLKGGHAAGDPVDLVWNGSDAFWLDTERINSRHTHGTGCTFSAAITAGLARDLPVLDAVAAAKDYITGAIRNARLVGRGINPVNHFWTNS